MGYDQKLADRVREALSQTKTDIVEQKMFGGMCFMVDGKMCICIRDDRLMCRVGPEKFDEAVERNGASPMMHGKRSMKGFIFVEPEGYKAKTDFDYWIKRCLEFNKTATPSKRK